MLDQSAAAQATQSAREGRRDVIVVGHRGASGVAPENTVAAIREAARQGADYAEVDVVLSKDGVPVLVHDNTLARTTNAREVFPDRAPWTVGDFTLAELRSLDAGSWFDESFAGERVPTFREALEAFDQYGIGVWLELKGAGRHPDFAPAVAEVLRTTPGGWLTAPDRERRFVATSFDWETLATFADLIDHAVPIGGIAEVVPDDAKLWELTGWMDFFIPHYRRLAQGDIVRIRAAGLRPAFWTPNDPVAVASLVAQGADALIQNYPALARAVVDGLPPVPGPASVVVERLAGGSGSADGAGAATSVASTETSRYVVLRNISDAAVDVGGWYLRDDPGYRLPIGAGYTIPAGGALSVHVGPGPNAPDRYHSDPPVVDFSRGRNSVALHRADGVVVDVAGDEPTA
ncbi:glycerophosphodiester phosphodiesterase family protein [Actinopolymorpha pittospori]